MNLAHQPRRIPLLWILLPYMAGLLLARHLPSIPILPLSAFAILTAVAAFTTARSYPKIWSAAIVLCVVTFGILRLAHSPIVQPEPPPQPPREAWVTLRLDTLYNTQQTDRAFGLATLLETPDYLSSPSEETLIYTALFLPENAPPPIEGATYRAFGVIRPLTQADSRNAFDDYLKSQGIHYRLHQGELRAVLAPAPQNSRFIQSAQNALSDTLSLNKQPHSPLSGAYRALMLGQKNELSEEQRELFLANGAMHLFAISGLHIGVIAICIHNLLMLLGFKGLARTIATLLLITAFVVVTGGSASSWRALLMIACLYLSHQSRRQPSPLSALVLSGLIYLLILPEQLFAAGFQMSYATVASILLLGLPFSRSLNALVPLFSQIPPALQSSTQRFLISAKTWFLNSLGISIAAFVSSSLLGLYYFQIFPTYGILINLVALPLASLAIIAGFLSLIFAPVAAFIPISQLFNNAALLVIQTTETFLAGCSALPASSIATNPLHPQLLFLSLATVIIFCCIAYTRSTQPKSILWHLTPIASLALSLAFLLRS